jgi:hypothetical protein
MVTGYGSNTLGVRRASEPSSRGFPRNRIKMVRFQGCGGPNHAGFQAVSGKFTCYTEKTERQAETHVKRWNDAGLR